MTDIKNTSVIDFSDISDEQMNEMIDGTLTEFDEGDLVDGTVVKIEHDEVLVDIGFKSEGVIPARELSIRKDADPSDIVSLGDKIEALVLQKEDKDGRLILSKKRAEYERAWISVEEKFKAGEVVTGEVIEVVKGGLILDIGLRGFLPASLVDLRRVKDLDAYLGTEIVPVEEEPTFNGSIVVIPVIGGTILLATLLLLGLLLRKNTTVYKATGKGNEYEKCGRLRLKTKDPELRIDRLKDIPEGMIAIEVDQAVAKKLFGQTIAIHCYDNTVEHTVGTVNGQYWFKVDIGTQEGEPDTEEEPV